MNKETLKRSGFTTDALTEPATAIYDVNLQCWEKLLILYQYQEITAIQKASFALDPCLIANLSERYKEDCFKNADGNQSIATMEGLLWNFKVLNINKFVDGTLISNWKYDTSKYMYYFAPSYCKDIATQIIKDLEKCRWFARDKAIILKCIENPKPANEKIENEQIKDWKRWRFYGLKGENQYHYSAMSQPPSTETFHYFPCAVARKDGDVGLSDWCANNDVTMDAQNDETKEDSNEIANERIYYQQTMGMFTY